MFRSFVRVALCFSFRFGGRFIFFQLLFIYEFFYG